MQLRHSFCQSKKFRSSCVFGHPEKGRCLHRHGSYERYRHPHGNDKIKIRRFLCKFTGRTISILPDDVLPYRPLPVPVLEAGFDQGSEERREPSHPSAVVEGCLRRAWQRFASTSRRHSLTAFFGQRLALTDNAPDLWQALRKAVGSLKAMLEELAYDGRSLLGDYRCLRP